MSMHNRKLAHEEERPCYTCGVPTKALNRGVMEPHPRCAKCKARFAEEFTKAIQQQRKQDQSSRPPSRQPSKGA
jgi:hypothetical protein